MLAESTYKDCSSPSATPAIPSRSATTKATAAANPQPALRKATLCPCQDWESSCPNPGDPGELSARHGIQFETEIPTTESLSGPITWQPSQFPEQSSVWRGGQCWAKMENNPPAAPSRNSSTAAITRSS